MALPGLGDPRPVCTIVETRCWTPLGGGRGDAGAAGRAPPPPPIPQAVSMRATAAAASKRTGAAPACATVRVTLAGGWAMAIATPRVTQQRRASLTSHAVAAGVHAAAAAVAAAAVTAAAAIGTPLCLHGHHRRLHRGRCRRRPRVVRPDVHAPRGVEKESPAAAPRPWRPSPWEAPSYGQSHERVLRPHPEGVRPV